MGKGAAPPAEALAVSTVVEDLFGAALAAVYLHGSAVAGGLRPRSDVDVLVVAERPMTQAMRERLLAALLRLSAPHPARPGGPRCVDLMVFSVSDLASSAYPARCAFVYGEWLRAAFEAGARPAPVADPEHTLVLAQARHGAKALVGPPATVLLPQIPDDRVRRAMRDALPALLANATGDAGNVLLTLARMWRTATTGDFVSKDAAAAWAVPRLPDPAAAVLAKVRANYLGRTGAGWEASRTDVLRATADLQRRVVALL